ncbi:hypothetical protein HDU96_002924 [Phlyctochytrium bullatum]|nr:hypothetical protein HDU96_002924 [Phlyctochytrium bullatum]
MHKPGTSFPALKKCRRRFLKAGTRQEHPPYGPPGTLAPDSLSGSGKVPVQGAQLRYASALKKKDGGRKEETLVALPGNMPPATTESPTDLSGSGEVPVQGTQLGYASSLKKKAAGQKSEEAPVAPPRTVTSALVDDARALVTRMDPTRT